MAKRLLVISEILGLFDNKLTTDDNYPVCNRENLPQPIEMQLCKKKFFLNFLLYFWKLHQSLNIYKNHIADVYPKLETAKNLVR